MSEMNLDDVKRLLDAATPGEWIARKGAGWLVTRPDATARREAAIVVGMTPATALVESPWFDDTEAAANAALIAAAPTIAAAYIEQAATIARLTAERDRLREALEKIAGEQNVYKGHGNYDTEPACSAEDAQKIARDELSKKCSTLRT